MLTREELKGMSSEELQRVLDNDINAYTVNLQTIVDKEELLQKEQELIGLMEENDQYLKQVVYKLPDNCMFDHQQYDKKTVFDFIIDFINTTEVEWVYSLGLYDMVKFWKNKDLEEIGYGVYDSTLRMLGQLKYKGFQAWKKILVINEYMSSCHSEYVVDNSYLVYLSYLHNALIDSIKAMENQAEANEVEPSEPEDKYEAIAE